VHLPVSKFINQQRNRSMDHLIIPINVAFFTVNIFRCTPTQQRLSFITGPFSIAFAALGCQ
jgi:hypothetical protein